MRMSAISGWPLRSVATPAASTRRRGRGDRVGVASRRAPIGRSPAFSALPSGRPPRRCTQVLDGRGLAGAPTATIARRGAARRPRRRRTGRRADPRPVGAEHRIRRPVPVKRASGIRSPPCVPGLPVAIPCRPARARGRRWREARAHAHHTRPPAPKPGRGARGQVAGERERAWAAADARDAACDDAAVVAEHVVGLRAAGTDAVVTSRRRRSRCRPAVGGVADEPERRSPVGPQVPVSHE